MLGTEAATDGGLDAAEGALDDGEVDIRPAPVGSVGKGACAADASEACMVGAATTGVGRSSASISSDKASRVAGTR